MAEIRLEDCVEPDHPSLPGHFPGRPIVPGVLLLNRVIAALQQRLGDVMVAGATSIKFLQALLPGQTYTIVLEHEAGSAQVKFRCEAAGRLLAQGALTLAAVP